MARSSRRGNYSVLMSAAVFIIFAFGMMSVDITLMRLSQQQTQDVADAASQAALLMYRVNVAEDGKSVAKRKAEGIARLVVKKNKIAGEASNNVDIDWGTWDNVDRVWDAADDVSPNAVHVTVSRDENQPVGFVLAPLFGTDSFETTRPSISSMRSLEVILSMDITGSWDKDNFYKARSAAVAFLDELHGNHGPEDVVGMTLFQSRYGWEYTRFTSIDTSAANLDLIRNPWNRDLNVGNVAGDFQPTWVSDTSRHIACKAYGNNSIDGKSVLWNNTWPCDQSQTKCYDGKNIPGGAKNTSYMNKWTPALPTNAAIPHRGSCHPNMPRYYDDEGGTDHSVGLNASWLMFKERNNPMAYRALVMLTDGIPSNYSAQTSSSARPASSFREYETTLSLPYDGSNKKMRQFKNGVAGLKTSGADTNGTGHTISQIQTSTVSVARSMAAQDDINIWFVSFVEEASYFEDAAQGNGYFAKAETADEIQPIFVQIARSLPAAIVQ